MSEAHAGSPWDRAVRYASLTYAANGANGGSTPAGSGNSWALSVIATIV